MAEEKILHDSISSEAQAAMIRKERRANNAWHKFCRNKSAVVGLVIVALMILMGVFAPAIATHDPNEYSVTEIYVAPCKEHLFGTDELGRDIFSRMMYGARMSIVVAIGATLLGGLIGVLLGLIAGYVGGAVDAVIMRIMDGMFAFPFILLSILLVTILGSGVFNVILAIAWSEARSLWRRMRNTATRSACSARRLCASCSRTFCRIRSRRSSSTRRSASAARSFPKRASASSVSAFSFRRRRGATFCVRGAAV